MTPKSAEKWAEMRSQGKWNFIWRVGILRWGLIMCGVFIGMQAVQHPNHILFTVALNIPVWLCAGFLFGLLTWSVCELIYRRYLAKNAPRTPPSSSPI